MENKTKFLSTRQVSEYLDLSIRTVQRLSERGKIKAIKLGSYWKYPEEDIKKYLTFGTNFSKEPARRFDNFLERRIYPRINTNFKCQYSVSLLPFKSIISEGIVKDLGAGGILLINQNGGMNNIDINDPVKMKFILVSDDNQKIDIKTIGRVVRKVQSGVGIKFRNIKEEDKNKIVKYIG